MATLVNYTCKSFIKLTPGLPVSKVKEHGTMKISTGVDTGQIS